jgi:alkylation response protein AidB-like acyl-CoA dehydrogenase
MVRSTTASDVMRDTSTAHGGSFLLAAPTEAPFAPEQLSDDHRAIAAIADEFWRRDVSPVLDAILRHEPGVAREALRKASELGLTAMQVAEADGGLELDLPSVMVAIEHLAVDPSYLGWHLGHAGIGMMPLILFGTAEQKAKYLPRLMSVELLGAYALTEPHAGTDALAARSRADLSADGRHYLLNGQKMWITNGGEADLFTVFAKVNGEAFTAFLVERAFGVTSGAEEHKMGLAGTSTTALYFDNVPVPIDNVLGEVGRGHVIALNVLNMGRLELGPNMLAGARQILHASLAYAAERVAFGQAINSFGAIQEKIADCVIRMFATESVTWRVVGLIEADTLQRLPGVRNRQEAELGAFEEFAAECSLVKILSSEMIDAVADHGVQIHGGAGYHRDSFVERAYRDARINRIFEGTNEINRLIVPGLFARRARRAGRRLPSSDTLTASASAAGISPAADAATAVDRLRLLAQLLFATAQDRYGETLREPQEVVMCLADVLLDTFTAESAHLRAQMMAGTTAGAVATAASQVCVHQALAHATESATAACAALLAPSEARTMLGIVRALTASDPLDTIALRRQIAAAAISRGRYPF